MKLSPKTKARVEYILGEIQMKIYGMTPNQMRKTFGLNEI